MVYSGDIGTVTIEGEMSIVDSTSAITIHADDEWHSVETFTEGLCDGFDYSAGSNGEIASIADASDGKITVTDVDHGLVVGNIITMNDCTDSAYNGLFEVLTVPSSSTFTVTAVYTATDTGYWQKGANLICTISGRYKGGWSASGISETNGHVFDFAPAVNTTISTKAKARRKFSNADYGSFSGCGLMNFVVGDVISFLVQNVGATGNVTIRTIDISIHKI